MARDKTQHEVKSGTHMVFENATGMVLADRLGRKARERLMKDPKTAMSLVTLDEWGSIAQRHSTVVAGSALTPEQLEEFSARGRVTDMLVQTRMVEKQPLDES